MSTETTMVWSPTYKLRYFYKSVDLKDIFYTERVLQQMWVSETGEEEWRDIPIVTEKVFKDE